MAQHTRAMALGHGSRAIVQNYSMYSMRGKYSIQKDYLPEKVATKAINNSDSSGRKNRGIKERGTGHVVIFYSTARN